VLTQRLAVAAVGLPLLALLLWLPERPFSIVVVLLLAAAAYELTRAAAHGAPQALPLSAAVACALVVTAARGVEGFRPWTLLPPLALVLVFLLAGRRDAPRSRASWWLLAVLYVGALGSHFVLLRVLEDGRDWVLLLLASTFATDTGAYAVGRLVGRHRMAPSISPGKTWEGAAGGLVFGGAALCGAAWLLELPLSPLAGAVMALAVPVAAEAGDLLESAIKRRIEVKDMSRLLPGHGGLLDRLDSLLLAGPSLYWLIRWLV
jgi:phosphatidate cytidylyltransferase